MGFECLQCGECCSHMGLVHKIRETRGDYKFLVYNVYTGEETEVEVDPDKRALFEDRKILQELQEACPFFRRNPDDQKAYCTVHLTWPDICREFKCWRLLILDHRGERAGRIIYQRSLLCEDETLRQLWDQCIDEMKEQDDAAWDEKVILRLSQAGYTIRR